MQCDQRIFRASIPARRRSPFSSDQRGSTRCLIDVIQALSEGTRPVDALDVLSDRQTRIGPPVSVTQERSNVITVLSLIDEHVAGERSVIFDQWPILLAQGEARHS